MKSTARIIAMLLVLTMAFALVAGCGETAAEPTKAPATDAPATQAPATQAPAETDAPAEPEGIVYPLVEDEATLTFWGTIYPGAVQYMDSRSNHPVIQAIGEATGVYLECTDVTSAVGQEQFNIAVNTGDIADLMLNWDSYYTAGFDAAISNGLLYNLMDNVQEWAPDYYAALQQYNVLDRITTQAGNLASFAVINDVANQDRGTIIRKDWLDAVKMDVPTTYDELYAVLTAWKNELGKTNGTFFLCNLGAAGGQTMSAGLGIADCNKPGLGAIPYSVDANGKVIFGWTADAYKELVQMYAQWFEEKLIWQDFMTANAAPMMSACPDAKAAWTNGEMGIGYSEVSDITGLALQSTDPDMFVIPMAPVTKNEGDTLTCGEWADNYTAGMCVTTECDDLELAMKYLNYYYTQEGSDLASWGIVGEACEIVDGKYQFTDLILKNPDDMPFKSAINVYCLETWAGLMQSARNLAVYTDEWSKQASEIWKSNGDGTGVYPRREATMNEDESTENATLFAEVDTYHAEMLLKFITGELDIDATWDEYIAQMNELGAERCTELRQAAYDRYVGK